MTQALLLTVSLQRAIPSPPVSWSTEYDSPLLTVVELPQLIEFPVFITVSDPENYTFALFGRDSQLGMEEEPVACVKFTLAMSGKILIIIVCYKN